MIQNSLRQPAPLQNLLENPLQLAMLAGADKVQVKQCLDSSTMLEKAD